MASFVGTFDEFIKYINPRAKYLVNYITKRYKAEKATCEHCGYEANALEAAHITGRERPKIIEEVLDEFRNGEIITVDLEVFENLFLEKHDPIDEVILVLCRDCHTKYDSGLQNNNTKIDENDLEALSEYNDQHMTNAQITDTIRTTVPKLNDDQVAELQDLAYCKETFRITYPVLKEIPIHSNQEQIRKLAQVKGYNRWSTQRPILRNGACFLVTTQWTDRHRENFNNWLTQLNINHQ